MPMKWCYKIINVLEDSVPWSKSTGQIWKLKVGYTNICGLCHSLLCSWQVTLNSVRLWAQSKPRGRWCHGDTMTPKLSSSQRSLKLCLDNCRSSLMGSFWCICSRVISVCHVHPNTLDTVGPLDRIYSKPFDQAFIYVFVYVCVQVEISGQFVGNQYFPSIMWYLAWWPVPSLLSHLTCPKKIHNKPDYCTLGAIACNMKIFICMGVLLACTQRLEEGLRSPGTGGTGGLWAATWGLETQT